MKHFHILLMFLLIITFVSCANIESDWDDTQKTNTVAGYDKFIQQYPNSSLADTARQRINDLLIKNAYKYESKFSGNEGANKIAVEGRESGFVVYAGTVKIFANPINDEKFSIISEPKDTKIKFIISGLEMDKNTGDLWSDVNLEFENGGVLPAKFQKPIFGEGGFTAVYPDAGNSTNVSIRVNSNLGYTEYAGLRFKKTATVAVRSDGTVEVDSPRIEVTDKTGQVWISREVMIDGNKTFVLWNKG